MFRGMGLSFGYNRAEGEHQYLSGAGTNCHLADVVSRGGCLLLNGVERPVRAGAPGRAASSAESRRACGAVSASDSDEAWAGADASGAVALAVPSDWVGALGAPSLLRRREDR